jgi:hypothetical protein
MSFGALPQKALNSQPVTLSDKQYPGYCLTVKVTYTADAPGKVSTELVLRRHI